MRNLWVVHQTMDSGSHPYGGELAATTFLLRASCSLQITKAKDFRAMPKEFTPAPAVRAPEFPDNLDWIHTGGKKVKLADLRGKIVFLDFWTYG